MFDVRNHHTLADLVWIRAVVLEDEVYASRGDVIAAASHPVESADQFEVDLFWMSEHTLLTALRSLPFLEPLQTTTSLIRLVIPDGLMRTLSPGV